MGWMEGAVVCHGRLGDGKIEHPKKDRSEDRPLQSGEKPQGCEDAAPRYRVDVEYRVERQEPAGMPALPELVRACVFPSLYGQAGFGGAQNGPTPRRGPRLRLDWLVAVRRSV